MAASTMMSLKPCAARLAVRASVSLRRGTPLVAHRASVQQRAARLVVRAADSAAVLEDVRGIIAEQLGKDLGDVKPDSKFADLGADSLDTVEIMMALEEKFDLQLDEEGAEKIATVQQAADLISDQVNDA